MMWGWVVLTLVLTLTVAVFVLYPLVVKRSQDRFSADIKLERETHYARIKAIKARRAKGDLDTASFNRETAELKLAAAKLLCDEERASEIEAERQRLELEVRQTNAANERDSRL